MKQPEHKCLRLTTSVTPIASANRPISVAPHNRLPTPPYSPATISAPPYSPTSPIHSTYPPTPSSAGGGFFQNSHSFVLNNPVLTDRTVHNGNIHNHNIHNGNNVHVVSKNSAMQELLQHVIPGAEFDSTARDPPPRCHPGTRQEKLQEMDGWCLNIERRLLWLCGAAGVGKSAIMQTFAETNPTILAASLFFSLSGGRCKASGIVPTLAYQVAVKIPEYRTYVSDLIDCDPSIFGKSLRQQFRQFISEPFITLRILGNQRRPLILIDGLDECEDQQAQCELVTLIASFVQSRPATPFLWVLASRREYHLRNVFARPEVKDTFMLLELPPNGSEACMDVERFLRKGFEKLREDFADTIPSTSPWPSERQFLAIARAANGLFSFAAATLRYVGDGSLYGDPVSQLDAVLSALEHRGPTDLDDNPFAFLDALYTHILSSVPARSIPILHQILGFAILRGPSTPLLMVANILDIPQHVMYGALQRLHSLLDAPQPSDANKKPLSFFHKSFGDYLMDPTRSGGFSLDMGKCSIKIALCYIQKLDLALSAGNVSPAIPLSWDHHAEENLGVQIVQEVKRSWHQVLPKIFMKWAAQSHETELDAFFDAFGRLHFNAFDISDALGFFNLVNWISSGSLPAVWNKLIADQMTAEKFDPGWIDGERTSVFYRTKPDRWGHWSANPVSLNAQSDEACGGHLERYSLPYEDFFGDFEILRKKDSLQVRVLIIGSDPSMRCAVFLSPEGKQEGQPVIRYYFPLRAGGHSEKETAVRTKRPVTIDSNDCGVLPNEDG